MDQTAMDATMDACRRLIATRLALTAVRHGVGAIMVDTGTLDVLAAVDEALRVDGVRERVTVGFGGGVTRKWLTAARAADVVDVGRTVLDAPLWDLRVEVRT